MRVETEGDLGVAPAISVQGDCYHPLFEGPRWGLLIVLIVIEDDARPSLDSRNPVMVVRHPRWRLKMMP